SRLSFYLLLLPLHLHSFPTRRSSDLPAALAGAAPACAPRVLVRSDEPDAAASDLLRRSEQGGVLLWRAREGFRARLGMVRLRHQDRKSTRLNSSHRTISYAVFCLKKK